MPTTQPPKLTKKQKKGIAFRDRKQGKLFKGPGKNGTLDSEEASNDVPVEENQDMAGLSIPEVEGAELAHAATSKSSTGKGNGKGKGKGKASDISIRGDTKVVEKAKKRKREEGEREGEEGEKPKQKKQKGSAGDATGTDLTGKDIKTQGKQRFILFLGNIKYTTTQEAIKEHFVACDPPPVVRLSTPKPSAQQRPIAKSKGCAFLEFSHRNALQQGLKMHQTELEGRRINVELTVGGGGKGEKRLNKVKERNKELDEQRKKRVEKEVKEGKSDKAVLALPERPQRFSTTSGLEQSAAGKRTWTVGEDDGETHRGGRKHSKAGKKEQHRSRVWGTGVNAIPVG